MFKNLIELIQKFNSEQACVKYLAEHRWKDGKAICPYCMHNKCYVIEGGKRYKCANKACYKRFHVTVGTIFHASNIPLVKWFMAVYIATAHKKGISSYQLGKDIGVTQKSAWFMLHRIREALKSKESFLLNGIVEVDETYVGGKMRNKHYDVRTRAHLDNSSHAANKTSIMGLLERGGKVRMSIIDKTKTLKNMVGENVSFKAMVITDSASAYVGLHKKYAVHSIVNHFEDEFVRGFVYTNTIEGFFSHFKRMVYGVYHQVSPKYMIRYCDECTYRFNSRKLKDADRFTFTLSKVNGILPYKKLVYNGKNDEEIKQIKAEKTAKQVSRKN